MLISIGVHSSLFLLYFLYASSFLRDTRSGGMDIAFAWLLRQASELHIQGALVWALVFPSFASLAGVATSALLVALAFRFGGSWIAFMWKRYS
ncbi:MAG: hypothetical protein AAFN13_08495 [Bacteroidota bacterium]